MISSQQTEYTAGSSMGQPMGVELTDDQRAVIDFVRTYHDEHGFIQDPHRLMAALSKRFAPQGGKRYSGKFNKPPRYGQVPERDCGTPREDPRRPNGPICAVGVCTRT